MLQKVNINGIETFIEISEEHCLSNVKFSGTKENYKIEYGNGLIKLGGIVTINTEQADMTEKSKGNFNVNFEVPFNILLDYQCTVVDNNNGSLFEHAYLDQVTNTGLNVYAQTEGTEPKEIKVKWYIEGVI